MSADSLITIPSQPSNQQPLQLGKIPTSCKPIPIAILCRIPKYLNQETREVSALVSRTWCMIMRKNPSVQLEQMEQRRVMHMKTLQPFSISAGPTDRFLAELFSSLSESASSEAEESDEMIAMRMVQNEMEKDPRIRRTISDICAIESAHSQLIPLYHAMNSTIFSCIDLTHELFSALYSANGEKVPYCAPFLRFPSVEGSKTTEEFFKQRSSSLDDYLPFDHRPAVRREVFSLNPQMFSNLLNGGESTWDFYLSNLSMWSPKPTALFKALCLHYNLHPTEKELETLCQLQSEMDALAQTYECLTIPIELRSERRKNRGVIIQILVPLKLIDRICWAALPYGEPEKSTTPLSQRCVQLRTEPCKDLSLQVRMLVQNIFVPGHHMKVIVHGYGGFYSAESAIRPAGMTEDDWGKMQSTLVRKKAVQVETRKLFAKLMLRKDKK